MEGGFINCVEDDDEPLEIAASAGEEVGDTVSKVGKNNHRMQEEC